VSGVSSVGIIGAGTMGAGIAQVAAQSGWDVHLLDVSDGLVQRAIDGIRRQLDRLVERGKLSAVQRDATLGHIHPAADAGPLCSGELIIEAVIEDLDTKTRVLTPLATADRPDLILASNTSSLSISRIGQAVGRPERVVGMHFFNPAPLMPLVEVVAGQRSDRAAVDRACDVARAWGKTPVRAKDTPGFIVNRVARGFYLESLRILGEGIAGADEIDRTLRTLGGFRMGPFELMDLIGIDVNYAVSCSVWEQLGRPARLAPHPIQQALCAAGHFGRKTGRGFYSYDHPAPTPAVPCERRSFDLPPRLYEAVRRFVDGAVAAAEEAGGAAAAAAPDRRGSTTEQYVFARVLAAIINEAALALDEQVASQTDINIAMRLATNYPRGPLEWADRIGRHTCASLLRALNAMAGDSRFTPAHALE
jgi:3-hydroxybutyryl-CoA dehydrogenase